MFNKIILIFLFTSPLLLISQVAYMDGWDRKIDTGRLILYSRFTIVYDLYRRMDLGIDNKESKYLTTIYKFSDCLNLKNDVVIIKT